MTKYRVEVGGFVSVYRQRSLVVSADNEETAKEKAINKFMDLQQKNGGDICDGGEINNIEVVE